VVAQAWKDGLIHPDGFATNIKTQLTSYFANGTVGFLPAPASWSSDAIAVRTADPDGEVVAFTTPKWDGGGYAKNWLSNGAPYMAAVKKASPDRVQEILRIMNYLASPWGTQEYMFLRYGIEGYSYTVGDDGSFTVTDDGKAEALSGLQYVASPRLVHYSPVPAFAQAEYESEKAGMDNTAPLPTVGLDSPTDLARARR